MKAVIFDIDGTLVDSVDLHAKAWQEAFENFGKHLEFQAVRDQIGKGGDELLPTFLSDEEIEQFGDDLKTFRGDLFKSKYMDKVKPLPGVRDLMKCLKEHGKRIAVGSSAKKDEVSFYLKLAKIDDLVEIQTCADDVSRSKPHPDVFEAALEKLKLQAEDVIVVGDSPFDAEAAKKAHMQTIGFLSGGFDQEKLVDAGAVAIFAGPEDLLAHYQTSPIEAHSAAA